MVETNQGLVLIDTGPGEDDYIQSPGILRVFRVITKIPGRQEETAVQQIRCLGYHPNDVRHIILTHMHFDHCGGLPDFPHACVHVHRKEYEAFIGKPRSWTDLAYVRKHIAHQPKFVLYEDKGEKWFDFSAMRLPFDPEFWLVPLFGHTRGHCGIAISIGDDWLFHVADAAPIGLGEYAPAWVVSLILGPHAPRLRDFSAAHPNIRITTGHMWLDFFANVDKKATRKRL
ncbi:MAG: MBL fold metallo-hydrolase [Anaerolineales bacterium]|nr:MBL fold metallo-hydrolase [Anaerolineales bacterium]